MTIQVINKTDGPITIGDFQIKANEFINVPAVNDELLLAKSLGVIELINLDSPNTLTQLPATDATLQQIRDRLSLDPYSGLKYYADETVGSTTYLLKAAGARWLLSKIVANATGNAAVYATVTNNPTVTTATAAWTARASLVYGELGGA